MQLRQPETVGIFNHHNSGVRNIHPHFDHNRAHENMDSAAAELSHYLFLLRRCHLPVKQTDSKLRKNSLRQKPMLLHGGLHRPVFGSVFVALNPRINKIGLPSCPNLPADKIHRRRPLLRPNPAGHNLPAPGRTLPDNRYIQIPENRHRQRSRYRRRRHHQTVRITPFAKLRTLTNPELVLLINNNQPQVGKLHILFKHGRCSRKNIHPAFGQLPRQFRTLSRRHPPDQQPPADTAALQISLDALHVLAGKNFRRSHDDGLLFIGRRQQCRIQRNNRLARTDIPLQQAIHRNRPLHIRYDFLNDALLLSRQQKRKAPANPPVNFFCPLHGKRRTRMLQMMPPNRQPQLHQKQLIILEPTDGLSKNRFIFRTMNLPIGQPPGNKRILFQKGLRIKLRHLFRKSIQRFLNDFSYLPKGQFGAGRIHRSAEGLGCFRFVRTKNVKSRIGQLKPVLVFAHLAGGNQTLAGLNLMKKIFPVKPHNPAQAALVGQHGLKKRNFAVGLIIGLLDNPRYADLLSRLNLGDFLQRRRKAPLARKIIKQFSGCLNP